MSWNEPCWLFVAVVALALLPAAWAVAHRRRAQQERLASRPLWLRWLGGMPATGGFRLALWLLAVAAAGVAAAGPRWGRPDHSQAAALDVVIALDVSDSMACTDISPSRLGRTVVVLQQTMDRFPGAAWGLVIGAGSARPLVPLTLDVVTLGQRLSDPDLPRWVTPGSNLAALLASGASLLPGTGPGRVILLATDGEELEGDTAAMAGTLRRSGIAIVPILAGTTSGAPVPRADGSGGITYARDAAGNLVRSRARPELLRAVGGGPDSAVDVASAVAPRTLAEALERAVRTSTREATPVHSGVFALLAALLGTSSFLLTPWRRVALVVVMLPTALAAASSPAPEPSAWQRLVPGSASLLAREAHHAAVRGAWDAARQAYARALALEPANAGLRVGLATAQARLGEPSGERALVELAASPGLAYAAWFNLGTARLVRGEFAGAADALRRAAAADPTRADVWHNLELALAGCRRERVGSSPPTEGESRERLVEAAARAALQPLLVRESSRASVPSGRDW